MEKICVECQRPFNVPDAWARRGSGRYCSRACYTIHQRKHPHTRAGVEAKPREIRSCAVCGKSFENSALRPNRIHCSRACYKASRHVDSICVVCGKQFDTYISTPRRYCSLDCQRQDSENVLHECLRCGTIFRGRPSRSYCSEECRRPAHTFVCLTCGKEVRLQPSHIQGSRFCSPQCYRRYTGETEPEANARRCLEQLGIDFVQEFAVPGWRYPADFHIPSINTILEIDGVYWHSTPKAKRQDARKTLRLQALGYRVVRLPDTPFYGQLTDAMVAFLREALKLADHASAQGDTASLYPIQISLPLDKERMI